MITTLEYLQTMIYDYQYVGVWRLLLGRGSFVYAELFIGFWGRACLFTVPPLLTGIFWKLMLLFRVGGGWILLVITGGGCDTWMCGGRVDAAIGGPLDRLSPSR